MSARNIVLKSVFDMIMKANPNNTTTTKKMRVYLRANAARFKHAANSAWTFTETEANEVAAQFEPIIAKRIERASKPKATRKAKEVAEVKETADA